MTAAEALAQVRRSQGSRLVAGLVRITGDGALAEDCVQDAFTRAWETWPRTGVPDNPAAWVSRAARHRALDLWRRSKREESKLRSLGEPSAYDDLGTSDDLLGLLFACTHPALALEGQVALTLRWVVGLSITQVSRAFLVSEDTMTRRLNRARTKVRDSGIPFAPAPEPWRVERLAGVLGVVYLLFNQGNDAGPQEDPRFALTSEALRLGRLVVELLPREAEPLGLLALMLLTLARRPARFSDGSVVVLELQDRSLWDRGMIAEGLVALDDALVRGDPGPYVLQAALAGCHARARRAQDTDYTQIAGLYARLEALHPTPVVRLHRAVALGKARGPAEGLALLETLAGESSLEAYPYYYAAQADLMAQLGRHDEARVQYQRAEALAPTEADRVTLERRRLALTPPAIQASSLS